MSAPLVLHSFNCASRTKFRFTGLGMDHGPKKHKIERYAPELAGPSDCLSGLVRSGASPCKRSSMRCRAA
jgi:hypothetical protein